MTTHGRKYGEKESHPIPLWNGVFEHYDRIDQALWEFVWCIDKITEERDGVGLVFGGAPVKLSAIVLGLKGSNRESVRQHLTRLVQENYIRRRRTPYGYVIEVLNSRKFGIWKRAEEKQQKAVSAGGEKHMYEPEKHAFVSEKPQKVVNKEDAAVDSTKDAAVEAAPPANLQAPWKLLGSDLPMGSPRFQGIFEHYATMRNGNPLSEAMERTIQSAQKRGVKVPPPFFDAKRAVERRELEAAAAPMTARPELEELPWRMR